MGWKQVCQHRNGSWRVHVVWLSTWDRSGVVIADFLLNWANFPRFRRFRSCRSGFKIWCICVLEERIDCMQRYRPFHKIICKMDPTRDHRLLASERKTITKNIWDSRIHHEEVQVPSFHFCTTKIFITDFENYASQRYQCYRLIELFIRMKQMTVYVLKFRGSNTYIAIHCYLRYQFDILFKIVSRENIIYQVGFTFTYTYRGTDAFQGEAYISKILTSIIFYTYCYKFGDH